MLRTSGVDLWGRSAELAALRTLLLAPDCRLVTMVGPPGIGKSRLAGALAAEVADRFGTVVHADLLDCRTPEAALALVADGLPSAHPPGTREGPLAERIREAAALVVLDSCEAVPGLGGTAAGLLAAARRIKVLATSQERLHIASERVYAVPPLAMPGPAPPDDLAALAAVPAMAMLLNGVRPPLTLTPENAPALVEICRSLQGLPLAIEIAAARLSQFEPAELVVRLRHRGLLLDAQLPRDRRHPSLRAAIAWSHDLLDAETRTVFRRLGVLPGSWSLSAAEAVAHQGEARIDVVSAVDRLVERSLVRRTVRPDGREVHDLLDTLRVFALEQLAAAGEVAQARQRFRAHFAELARAAEAAMGTPEEPLSLQWHDGAVTIVRAALHDAVAADAVREAVPLAAYVGWLDYTHGTTVDHGLLRTVLDRATSVAELEPGDLGGLVLVAGVTAWSAGDLPAAKAYLRHAVDLAAVDGQARRAAVGHAFLGHVARTSGHLSEAGEQHERARAGFAALGNRRGTAWAAHDLGLVALARGDLVVARQELARALEQFEQDGDRWATAWARSGLGEVAAACGDVLQAAALVGAARAVYVEIGDGPRVAHCDRLLAEVRRAAESPLTQRQREVAVLVSEGATNRQIARRLGIRDKTVEMHLTQIMGRLGVVNRAQVAAHAVATGLTGQR